MRPRVLPPLAAVSLTLLLLPPGRPATAQGGPELPPGLRRGERAGEFVNEKDGTVLVWVPSGSFAMGATGTPLGDAEPVHDVRFARGYFLAKHETTWAQYRAFCRATERAAPPAPAFPVEDTHPVVNVTWADAAAYCAWAGLRLPSEAEWEYAARGGDGRSYPWGRQEPDATRCNLFDASCPDKQDWKRPAPYDDGHGRTAPVGSYPAGASPFGCLDMAGNVLEWVQDAHHDDYKGAPSDGSAWEEAQPRLRIGRGGAWVSLSVNCTATSRQMLFADRAYAYVGLRPAR